MIPSELLVFKESEAIYCHVRSTCKQTFDHYHHFYRYFSPPLHIGWSPLSNLITKPDHVNEARPALVENVTGGQKLPLRGSQGTRIQDVRVVGCILLYSRSTEQKGIYTSGNLGG